MYTFNLCLAGKVIKASVQYESTERFCEGYLTEDEADLEVSVSPSDLAFEKIKAMRERELEGKQFSEPSLPYLETLALYRKIAEALVGEDIILFHGSAIALDGEVYLFTAKSGTGKSTHTKIWREVFGERAVMINDDKPLLKITQDGVTVYGTPWNGKHRLGSNVNAPLKAICILERSKENHIKEENPLSTFPEILSQTYRFVDVEGMKRTLALIDKMLGAVKVYRLGCNMEKEAAIVSYNGMR